MMKNNIVNIHIWYGNGNNQPLGPMSGLLIQHNPQGRSKIQITDQHWLDQMGYDGQYFYDCKHLPEDCYVSYDDYAWCYPGECDLDTKWW